MTALPEIARTVTEAGRMAMRVAASRKRREDADQYYKAVQADAMAVFAEYRRRGFPQVEVRIPDGTKVALISIDKGAEVVHLDEDVLAGVIAINEPEAFEDCAVPAALADPEVLALLIERFPQHVQARIKPDVVEQYRKEAAENGGRVFLRGGSGAGGQVTVAAVEHLPASGRYSVRWESKGMSLLGDAIDAGLVSEWGDVTADEPAADEDVPRPGAGADAGTADPPGPGHTGEPPADDTEERLERARARLAEEDASRGAARRKNRSAQ